MNNIDSQCPRCSGTGYVAVKCDYCRAEKATCGECKGTGNVSGREVVMSTQDEEELRQNICKALHIYPEEIQHNLPVNIGEREIDSLLRMMQSIKDQTESESAKFTLQAICRFGYITENQRDALMQARGLHSTNNSLEEK